MESDMEKMEAIIEKNCGVVMPAAFMPYTVGHGARGARAARSDRTDCTDHKPALPDCNDTGI